MLPPVGGFCMSLGRKQHRSSESSMREHGCVCSADPNCMAKILMVDGDHRVGIYARKDIRPGTELTYDYCYSIEQAPSWARARRQSKKAAEPVAAQAQKLATG